MSEPAASESPTADHLSQAASDGWASYQRRSAAPRHRRRLISKLLEPISDRKSIADVGCGRGALIAEFSRTRSSLFYGYDLSGTAIEKNQRDFPNAHFEQLDLSTTPLPRKHDVVICSEVLEHLPDWRLGLNHLISGAQEHLILTVPAGQIGTTDRQVGHITHFNGRELKEELAGYGFETIQLLHWGFPFHTLYKQMINGPFHSRIQERFLDRPATGLASLLEQVLYVLFFCNLSVLGRQLVLYARKPPQRS